MEKKNTQANSKVEIPKQGLSETKRKKWTGLAMC